MVDRDCEGGGGSLVGQLFAGRFRIEALLGSGGMGAVYLARHEVLQRLFALKLMRRELLADVQLAARFRREAKAASRIDHPHVAYVFDYGHSEDGVPYLAMEFVEGESLASVLASGPLGLDRALSILSQIVEGLAAAHAAQVIHRDLKPANVMLAPAPTPDFVKLLDFGVAKVIGQTALTAPGECFGSPQYMSPEQCTGDAVDLRTDIYSVGILAFELLSGSVPFGGSAVEVLSAHVKEPPPVEAALRARGGIPPQLTQVILRCLGKRPADRYRSAAELLEELRPIAGAAVNAKTSAAPPRRSPSNAPLSDAALMPTVASPTGPPRPDEPPGPAARPLPATAGGALEALVEAVCARGMASLELARCAAAMVEARDRAEEAEAAIAVDEAEAARVTRAAHDRSARLRRALEIVQQACASVPASPDARTLRASSAQVVAVEALEQMKERLAGRLREVSIAAENKAAALSQSLSRQRDAAGALRDAGTAREREVLAELRALRSQLAASGAAELLRRIDELSA